MAALENKIDFAIAFAVNNANPNGDPLNGNAMRSVRQGGRRDIFLGARECQAYVEPCEFGGGEGFYDSYGEWNMGYMFHGFSYPDENPDHNLISRFWMPIMKDGVIRFESPDSPLLDRHIVRHGLNVKEFNLGKNVTSVEEE